MNVIADEDYDEIIENIQKKMLFINEQIGNTETSKIWMAYPECDQIVNENTKYTKIINQRVKSIIEANDSLQLQNWIYFQLKTPSLPKYCEGFHVRDRWTMIENTLLTNALCIT